MTIVSGDRSERVTAKSVTGSYFPLVGQHAHIGRLFEPAEALKLGALDELVEADQVVERALVVAGELASSPPDTYARVKRQVRGSLLTELERIVRDEDDPLLDDWLSEDVSTAASGVLRSDR